MPATTQTIRRTLKPGLYRLTVDGDAGEFDWESLYLTLTIYNNVNQRTGPWDFNLLDNNRPLLPAYWVHLNDRRIGLWYFNRPSHAEINAKRFKGEASFWITAPGDYEFRFEPYQSFELTWADSRFEPEPEDKLLDRVALKPEAQRGLQRIFNAACWERLRQRLLVGAASPPRCVGPGRGGDAAPTEPTFSYRQLLEQSLAWAKQQAQDQPASASAQHDKVQQKFFSSLVLPLLTAAVRMRGDQDALRLARYVVEHFLALPAWGNPREDGYGHNGDMGAANVMLDLAWTLNFLGDDLGKSLAQRVLARLEMQGDKLLEPGLLHRGYWGGSVIQDHGFCSFSFFTSAAYSLLGWTPRAEHWLRFCLPRMQRTMDALPTDGVVPQTSYHLLFLYTDKMVLFRELHRQATGEDVYERPAWRNVPHFAYVSYVPEQQRFLHACTRGDLVRFFGGHPFLDQMARAFGDAEAGWLAREYRRTATSEGLYHGVHAQAMYQATLWAALLYEPVNLPEPTPSPRRLDWFRDTGAILYRDDAHGLVLSARCGPPHGLTAWKNATGCCDRIALVPASGIFALVKRGRALLQNAESGYKVRTELANVMLVDGQGQLGDHAPPMGCPDAPYGGEQIEEASVDCVRMQLTPAYDPELQLTRYTREFCFEPDGKIRLVDRVASAVPHRFGWLFHTFKSHPIQPVGPLSYRIQNQSEHVTLTARQVSTLLTAKVDDTLVVWAYCNENLDETFQHIAFTTEQPVNEVTVEFELGHE